MMVASMLGGGIGAIGSMQQSQAQADAYRRQAAEDRTNAQLQQRLASTEEITGQYQQRRMADKATQTAAQQITDYASGGVTLQGSPTSVIVDSRRNAALDIDAARYNTDLKSDNRMFQARNYAANADDADKAADTTENNAWIGALSPLIGSFSKLGGGF